MCMEIPGLAASVLSYIDVQEQVIPDNVVLHGLKQRNGKFIVRIFGVNDNPKENRLFGRDLDELEDTLGVRLWEENGQAHTCGLLRCIRRQIRSGRQQMRHWNFMRLSQEGKILTDLYGLQLPTSLSAPDLMRRIRMLS